MQHSRLKKLDYKTDAILSKNFSLTPLNSSDPSRDQINETCIVSGISFLHHIHAYRPIFKDETQ